jgi:hypothetical protein
MLDKKLPYNRQGSRQEWFAWTRSHLTTYARCTLDANPWVPSRCDQLIPVNKVVGNKEYIIGKRVWRRKKIIKSRNKQNKS